MTTSADTATLTICHCGWIAVAPNYNETASMFAEHVDWNQCDRKQVQVIAAGNPIPPDLIPHLRRKAKVRYDENRVMEFLGRYKVPEMPRLVDDGLGAFRGLWSVVKGLGITAAIGLACWGLWRLA